MLRTLTLSLAAFAALSAAAPAFAQIGPGGDPWRRPMPRCIDSWDVPSVLMSRGYRNARVIDRIDSQRVAVIARNSQGQFRIVFDLCREEIDSREAL